MTKNFKALIIFLSIFHLYFVSNPTAAFAQCTPTGLGVCISNDPAALVNQIVTVAIGVAGGISFLMLVSGGFRMVFSQGNPEAIQDARQVVTGAIIGLLVVIFSVFFLNLIGINILGLPI